MRTVALQHPELKVVLVCPRYCATDLNHHAGHRPAAEGGASVIFPITHPAAETDHFYQVRHSTLLPPLPAWRLLLTGRVCCVLCAVVQVEKELEWSFPAPHVAEAVKRERDTAEPHLTTHPHSNAHITSPARVYHNSVRPLRSSRTGRPHVREMPCSSNLPSSPTDRITGCSCACPVAYVAYKSHMIHRPLPSSM